MKTTGIDIIEIPRIKSVKPKFILRNFSADEIAYFKSKKMAAQTIAGNWAAKEAYIKARGGIKGFCLRELEVLRKGGVPYIKLHGSTENCSVSISHTKEYAVAVVIIFVTLE